VTPQAMPVPRAHAEPLELDPDSAETHASRLIFFFSVDPSSGRRKERMRIVGGEGREVLSILLALRLSLVRKSIGLSRDCIESCLTSPSCIALEIEACLSFPWSGRCHIPSGPRVDEAIDSI